MTKKNKTYWKICIAAVIAIIILGYTPLVIPTGIYTPKLFGLPYSLWLGFLLTTLLVVLTFIGSRVHPGTDINEEE